MINSKTKNNSIDISIFDLKPLKLFAQKSESKTIKKQKILNNTDIKTLKNYLKKQKKRQEIILNYDNKDVLNFKNFEQLTRDYSHEYSCESNGNLNKVFGFEKNYQLNGKLSSDIKISNHEKMTLDIIDGEKPTNNTDFNVNFNDINKNSKTTLMIKNIPNKFTKDLLVKIFNKNFKTKFNYFHLPMDSKNNCNMGYAFINLNKNSYVKEFYSEFNKMKWNYFNSEKICEIKYARYQGFDYYNKSNKKVVNPNLGF